MRAAADQWRKVLINESARNRHRFRQLALICGKRRLRDDRKKDGQRTGCHGARRTIQQTL
jgi:hypothetical protein